MSPITRSQKRKSASRRYDPYARSTDSTTQAAEADCKSKRKDEPPTKSPTEPSTKSPTEPSLVGGFTGATGKYSFVQSSFTKESIYKLDDEKDETPINPTFTSTSTEDAEDTPSSQEPADTSTTPPTEPSLVGGFTAATGKYSFVKSSFTKESIYNVDDQQDSLKKGSATGKVGNGHDASLKDPVDTSFASTSAEDNAFSSSSKGSVGTAPTETSLDDPNPKTKENVGAGNVQNNHEKVHDLPLENSSDEEDLDSDYTTDSEDEDTTSECSTDGEYSVDETDNAITKDDFVLRFASAGAALKKIKAAAETATPPPFAPGRTIRKLPPATMYKLKNSLDFRDSEPPKQPERPTPDLAFELLTHQQDVEYTKPCLTPHEQAILGAILYLRTDLNDEILVPDYIKLPVWVLAIDSYLGVRSYGGIDGTTLPYPFPIVRVCPSDMTAVHWIYAASWDRSRRSHMRIERLPRESIFEVLARKQDEVVKPDEIEEPPEKKKKKKKESGVEIVVYDDPSIHEGWTVVIDETDDEGNRANEKDTPRANPTGKKRKGSEHPSNSRKKSKQSKNKHKNHYTSDADDDDEPCPSFFESKGTPSSKTSTPPSDTSEKPKPRAEPTGSNKHKDPKPTSNTQEKPKPRAEPTGSNKHKNPKPTSDTPKRFANEGSDPAIYGPHFGHQRVLNKNGHPFCELGPDTTYIYPGDGSRKIIYKSELPVQRILRIGGSAKYPCCQIFQWCKEDNLFPPVQCVYNKDGNLSQKILRRYSKIPGFDDIWLLDVTREFYSGDGSHIVQLSAKEINNKGLTYDMLTPQPSSLRPSVLFGKDAWYGVPHKSWEPASAAKSRKRSADDLGDDEDTHARKKAK